MTAAMRRVVRYLATCPELTGQVYVHRNTRAALERRGMVVRLGAGLYGLTTLGLMGAQVRS